MRVVFFLTALRAAAEVVKSTESSRKVLYSATDLNLSLMTCTVVRFATGSGATSGAEDQAELAGRAGTLTGRGGRSYK